MTSQDSPGPGPRRLIRLPLVPVAAALVVGCLAGRLASVPMGVFLALSAGAIGVGVSALCLRLGSGLVGLMVLLATFALGAAWTQHCWREIPADHILTFTGDQPQLATIRGRVATSPIVRPPRAAWQEPSTVMLVEIESIRSRAGQWLKTEGLVRVTIDQPAEKLHAGMSVELPCWLGRYQPSKNPGQYDSVDRAWLDRVFVWGQVKGASAVQLRPDDGSIGSWLGRWVGYLRSRSRQRLAEAPDVGDEQGGQITQALILGHRSPALTSLNDTMRRAGIAHFLSISGLHLAVFLGFIYALCRLLFLTPRRSAVVVLVVLGAYLLLAEPRAPLLRSALMAAMVAIGVIAHRPVRPANSLASAAILLLAIDPLQLFTPGFQLSFAIVAALIVLHEPMKRWLFGRLYRMRGLMVYRDATGLARRTRRMVVDGLINALVLSLTAYLAAAPLAAMHFGLFSPYAVILSLVLFPLIAAVLIPGYLAMLLGPIAPNLSGALASLAGQLASVLSGVVVYLERLPGLSIDIQPLGWAWLVISAACLTAAIWLVRRRGRVALAAAGTCMLVVAAATAWTQLPTAASPQAQLDLLSVGSGQLALLRLPHGPTVLIDGGSINGGNLVESVLRPFLLDQRLPWPRKAFVSHGNVDHYGLVEDLARQGRLDTVYLSEHFQRGPQATEGERRFLEVLAEAGVETRRISPGQDVKLGARTHVEVLWPIGDAADLSGNDLSLVLRVVCDETAAIFPGDIEASAMTGLLGRCDPLDAAILILPHHGSWQDQLPDLVRRIDPKIVLVSRGRAMASTGSAGAFFAQLARDRKLLTTRQSGWIRTRFGLGSARVVDTAR